EFLFVVLGLNRLRAIGSLLNTNATGAPLIHAINVCEAKAVVVGSEHANAVLEVKDSLRGVSGRLWVQAEPGCEQTPAELERINEGVKQQLDTRPPGLAAPNSSEVMCYIYTSGTTGLPKAAIITNK